LRLASAGLAPASACASRSSQSRPSSSRATDRRSSRAVQPSSGCEPGRFARLHGRLSWVSEPPRLRAFSARRVGTFAVRRLPAQVVSPRVGRRSTSPPEGLAYRRRWTLARHLSCAFSPAAEVACGGAPESPSPSEVASSCEAAIPFRGSWFVVVPPDEDDTTGVAIGWQATHRLSTVAGTGDCIARSGACCTRRKLQKFSPRSSTACGERTLPQTMSRTRGAARALLPVPRG